MFKVFAFQLYTRKKFKSFGKEGVSFLFIYFQTNRNFLCPCYVFFFLIFQRNLKKDFLYACFYLFYTFNNSKNLKNVI